MIKSNWSHAVLICRKCSKKLGDVFGPNADMRLAKALKREGGGKKRKAAFGVIETGCLDICPKGSVTVIDTRSPGRWHLVKKGADVRELVRRLDDEAQA